MMDADALQATLFTQIEARQDELITLLCDLLRYNTENPPGNSGAITAYIADYLARHGIATSLHVALDAHHNLLGEIGMRRPGKRLLFCGHTDVVPAGNFAAWQFPAFAADVVDGYARGRGASDMKGGLAAYLFGAALLAQYQSELAGSIGLVVVDDEETGGRYGTQWLLESGLVQGHGCIIAEPSAVMNPTIGQKGSCWFEVTVRGTAAHGSLAPLAGDNAILKACAVAQQLQKLHQLPVRVPYEIAGALAITRAELRASGKGAAAEVLDHVSVNVGVIHGGSKTNIVPDSCTIEVDTRVPFGLTHLDVLAHARALLDELGYAYELRPLAFQSAPNYTLPDDPVVQALLHGIRAVHGGEPYGVLQWASSDARHFRAHGIPVLQYGPAELETIHAANERVRVADVVARAKVYVAAALAFVWA